MGRPAPSAADRTRPSTRRSLAWNRSIRRTPPLKRRDLLLKRSLLVAWARECGAREVRFYRMVARRPDHPPMTVRCFDAAIDPETGDSYLLLKDLTPTH